MRLMQRQPRHVLRAPVRVLAARSAHACYVLVFKGGNPHVRHVSTNLAACTSLGVGVMCAGLALSSKLGLGVAR